jgi:hypothetical protein
MCTRIFYQWTGPMVDVSVVKHKACSIYPCMRAAVCQMCLAHAQPCCVRACRQEQLTALTGDACFSSPSCFLSSIFLSVLVITSRNSANSSSPAHRTTEMTLHDHGVMICGSVCQ